MNRQKVLLTILAGLLVLALGYAYRATPRQAKVSGAEARRAAATTPERAVRPSSGTDELRVQLELLQRETGTTPDFKRNIFHFRQPAPKPLPPPPPPPPPPAVPTGASLGAEEVQRELARFTFLGFLLKDGVRTIFLSANEEIFIVKQGDRFGQNKRFLVTALTPEKLTVEQEGDPRPIIVPLVEQAPLVERPPLIEAPGYTPAPEPAARTSPTRRRRQLLPERSSEVQQPVEMPEAAAPPEPTEPSEQSAPAITPEAAVPAPAAEKAPEKDPFAVEFKSPQGTAPQ